MLSAFIKDTDGYAAWCTADTARAAYLEVSYAPYSTYLIMIALSACCELVIAHLDRQAYISNERRRSA